MRVEIRVPSFSESITEGTLLEWRVSPGQHVEAHAVLTSLETDKVVLEVPAPSAGAIAEILKPPGSVVHAGEVLATFEPAQAAAPEPSAARPAEPSIERPAEPSTEPSTERAPSMGPAARRLVEQSGIDPSRVPASGRRGRLSRQDVQAYLEAPAAEAMPAITMAPPIPAEAPAGPRATERVPMSRLRMRIAERLQEVQRTTAMLTTFNEADMGALSELRARHREAFLARHGVKLGLMGFFVQAACRALERYPVVNASLEDGAIVYHRYCDIGLAVATERGLVVPVLRNAERLGLAEIEAGLADFAARARQQRLQLAELEGGTFSITNGGVFGSLLSTPMLNAPQSAILGMHAIQPRPVARGDAVLVRPMMYLALTYDHRLIDGQQAVSFLVALKELLEDPVRLWLAI